MWKSLESTKLVLQCGVWGYPLLFEGFMTAHFILTTSVRVGRHYFAPSDLAMFYPEGITDMCSGHFPLLPPTSEYQVLWPPQPRDISRT